MWKSDLQYVMSFPKISVDKLKTPQNTDNQPNHCWQTQPLKPADLPFVGCSACAMAYFIICSPNPCQSRLANRISCNLPFLFSYFRQIYCHTMPDLKAFSDRTPPINLGGKSLCVWFTPHWHEKFVSLELWFVGYTGDTNHCAKSL